VSNRRKRRSEWKPQPNGHTDPRRLGGDIAGPGGPHDQGAVVIDGTDAILMESLDICVIDQVHAGKSVGTGIYLVVDGRINKTSERARVGIVCNTDGAAAMVTELLALTHRAGPEMLRDLAVRLVHLDRTGTGSTAWLRAALDLAEEES
jgi:hypothetical protein